MDNEEDDGIIDAEAEAYLSDMDVMVVDDMVDDPDWTPGSDEEEEEITSHSYNRSALEKLW